MFRPRHFRTSPCWSRLWLLLLLQQLGLLPSIATAQQQGIQSVGGSSAYSFVPTEAYLLDSLLYVAGYDPIAQNCYLTQMDVSTTTYKVLAQIVLPNAGGTCTALTHVADKFVLAGYTTASSDQTTAAFQVSVPDDAFYSIATTTASTTAATTTSISPTVFDDASVTAVYPIALAADESSSSGATGSEQRVFALEVGTASTNPPAIYDAAVPPASDSRLGVRRITYNAVTGYTQVYRFTYSTTRNGQAVPLIPADMILLGNDQLIVVGTAYGGGGGLIFGDSTSDAAAAASTEGFVVKFDASSDDAATFAGNPTATRLGTTTSDAVVLVHGACVTTTMTDNALYVVGSTTGTMTLVEPAGLPPAAGTQQQQAFVAKLDVATLSIVWIQQWGATGSADGVSGEVDGLVCAATDTDVYVAGTVSAGATVTWAGQTNNNAVARGGQDVYVAQIMTDNGSVVAVTQLGSDRDDHVADVVVNGATTTTDRNVLLIGSTQGGSWFGPSSGNVDWVVTPVQFAPLEMDDNFESLPTTLQEGDAPATTPVVVVVWDSTMTVDEPDEVASTAPSVLPSDMPSLVPSYVPSLVPSVTPSLVPSDMPSLAPSITPTTSPSLTPNTLRGGSNTLPTAEPTTMPSQFVVRSTITNTTDTTTSIAGGGGAPGPSTTTVAGIQNSATTIPLSTTTTTILWLLLSAVAVML